MHSFEELMKELNSMVNRLYSSPEVVTYNSFPITLARAKVMRLHRFRFSRNRRDCWAAAQSTCPMDVKRLIWEHEKEELTPSQQLGGHNFWSSLNKVIKLTGLSAEEVYIAELIPGCKAALRAWLYLARDSCWLKAFSGTAVLEMVKEGGGTVRETQRYTEEVRRLLEDRSGRDVGLGVHEEPSDIMDVVLERYGVSEEAQRHILEGARDSLDFNRAFMGSLAVALEKITE